VTSIERTAYPRFGRLLTACELDGLAPVAEEQAIRSEAEVKNHPPDLINDRARAIELLVVDE
jgi:hypothetical protein